MPSDLAALAARIATLERRLTALTRTSRLAHSSIEDGAVEVYDGAGSLRAVIGQQPDGTTGVNVVNAPPPPQPTAPAVTSVLGGVAVTWSGTFTEGSPTPLDFARVEIHVSTAEDFIPGPGTLRATIESPQGGTCTVVTDDPVHVRLLARNTSGTGSAPSAPVGPHSPTPVVAAEVLDGIVTTLKLADDAVTAAKLAVGAVGSDALAVGSVQTGALAADSVAAGKIAAGAVTAREIAALAVTADKVEANTITADKLAAGSVTTAALAASAITGQSITGGSITGTTINGGSIEGATMRVVDGDAGTFMDLKSGAVYVRAASGEVIGALTGYNSGSRLTAAQLWTERNGDGWKIDQDGPGGSGAGQITFPNVAARRAVLYQTTGATPTLVIAGPTTDASTQPVIRLWPDGDIRFGATATAAVISRDGNISTPGRIRYSGDAVDLLTLEDDWREYNASSYGVAQVWRDACGVIHASGRISGPSTIASGSVIATMSSAFAPDQTHNFPKCAMNASAHCNLLVDRAGNIKIFDISGRVTNVSLSGMSWRMT